MYIYTGTGKVTRGCGAKDSCPSGNCFSCSEDSCNTHIICKKCDATDASCSQTNADDAKYNQVCNVSNSCIKQVKDKQVVRGCVADNPCGSANTDTCNVCKDANCNVGIFPEKRRLCHQCENSSCNDVSSASPTPCLLYDAAEKCYTKGDSADTMVRGCQSDTAAKCSAGNTDDKCLTCDSADGCNNLKFERTVSCFQCSDATDCAEAQDSNATECSKPVSYLQANECYSQVKNGLALRGCFIERDEQLGTCSEETSCTSCASAGCNKAALDVTFTCVRCRSDNFGGCRNNAANIGGEKCSNSTAEEKCFWGQWDGIVLRGCLSDADYLTTYQCNNPKDNRCHTCTTSNCNTKAPSGASTLQSLGVGLNLLLVFGFLSARWRVL
ncbi:uncharacterized protein LOC115631548 isoform X2 [Scaptodrosophila lebanonensis]|uniref:Uncharacterized protein LOC115631548 isoform X2 n=1 Tax=Drosophila lebanonensis TaxID=7225 RepID=A0A6J2U775_DROLE|nr:uncharacterized protein LOC115631548 isoform X2 [Scaptodrosophila lebanonensis]